MKTLGKLVTAVTVSGVFAAACGGGSTATSTPTTVANTPTRAAALPTSAPVATSQVTATAVPVPTATAVPLPTGSIRWSFSAVPGYALYPGVANYKAHLDPMYDALIGTDNGGNQTGNSGFISSWTSSADGLQWTFKTREGVLFHDGSKATAKDIKYSLEWYKSPETVPNASASAARARTLDRVDVVDERTAVAVLKQFELLFILNQLTLNANPSGGYLLSADYGAAKGFKEANRSPLGSGPFKYKSDVSNQELVLEAIDRPHWLYGVPKYRTAQAQIIPDYNTATALLKSGGLDGGEVLRASLPDLKKQGYTTVANPNEKFARIFMLEQHVESFPNYGKNPFYDANVRKALNLALDREVLVKQFIQSLGRPAMAQLPPVGALAKQYPIPTQDIAAAKKLVTDAGFAGATVDYYAWSGLPGLAETTEISEAVNVWWEQIGLKINRKPIDVIAFNTENASKKTWGRPTVYGIVWGPPTPNVGIPPTTQYKDITGVQQHEDPEWLALSHKINQAKSMDEYNRLVLAQADRQVADTRYLYLFYSGGSYALKSGFGGEKWNFGINTYNINLAGLYSGKPEVIR